MRRDWELEQLERAEGDKCVNLGYCDAVKLTLMLRSSQVNAIETMFLERLRQPHSSKSILLWAVLTKIMMSLLQIMPTHSKLILLSQRTTNRQTSTKNYS